MVHHFENAGPPARFHQEELRILEKALRRILRANDLQSRALARVIGLTAPQLVILKCIAALGEVTTTALSAQANLSPATVTTILDKLEERGIIQRYRSAQDRRVVHTRLTEKGIALLANAPEPLGESFVTRFAELTPERRRQIVNAVSSLADLMTQSEEKPDKTPLNG
ncbi:MarR family winged helix-turn-helix transcriptional regulator [Chelativorans sp. YIM 93263]|uniref:MarR family winged helix-turn-helix transcriptional regulator n=1 Tax=Chelativorans sp. YIM 93263 TaxID=2906648 RepID=UPI002378749D|nr:MarR family transcriptional regulator [Chelativorans sp. YIM 93263]